jgi:trk system potassium uptake protein TrkA
MYVVILGAGRIGVSLARWLLAAQHEVTVIDNDATKCAALDDELGSISVVGDGTEAGILGRAGVNRADIFIASTERDDHNMVACQLAKHRFGASHTISLASISDYETLFSRLGIDLTINITELAVARIQEGLRELLAEEMRGLG